MKPKKRLGQHFLHEKSYLERIVEECPLEGKPVLEIGAGPGNLTRYLVRKASEVFAVEKDPEAVSILRRADLERVKVVEADALEIPWDFFEDGVCAGNLPYYIASLLVRKFLENWRRFSAGCFLLQWELAEKFASPRGRKTSPLSLLLYNFYTPQLKFKVPPGAFVPPPKVQSGFLVLERRPAPLFNFPLEEMEEFLRRVFSQRRKTIYNNLRAFYPPDKLQGLDRRIRPEEVGLEEIFNLFEALRSS